MGKEIQEGEDKDALPPASGEAPEKTPEELKQLYSESSREARYLAESKKVLKDNRYLLEVAKHNRPLAERIAKDDFGTSLEKAIEDVTAWIDGQSASKNEESAPPAGASKTEFEAWYAEIESKKAFESITKELGIDDDSEKSRKVIEEYSFLSEGKRMTPDNVRRLLKTAYKTVVGTEADESKKAKGALTAVSGNGGSGGASKSDEKPKFVRNDGPQGWY